MKQQATVVVQPESIKSLFIEMMVRENVLSSGTGFIVSTKKGPALLKNRHNFTGRHQDNGEVLSTTGGVPDQIRITHYRETTEEQFQWTVRVERLYDKQGAPLWYEHPILGAKADFAALLLTRQDDVSINAYDPSRTGIPISVVPGDVVSVIGFPFGIRGAGSFAIWSTGFVATEPEIDWSGIPVFLIDCRSRPGQSGSPVIAFRNAGPVPLLPVGSGRIPIYNGPVSRFLGIYSGRINEKSDLGIVWRAKALAQLIDAI